MDRCNDLCTKDAIGYCALCEARAEANRFIRFWFKGGLFIDGVRVLRQWWYPVPHTEVRHTEVRHQAVVREAHKQYSETLNKTMLTLLGVALFCVLTTLGSPDKLLLADSTIKIPLADTQLPFLGFIVVAPLLLIVLVTYLHIFYGYWLECERERQYLNQRLIPPIESVPTLFSFPDTISRRLTSFIFYWLVPLVLVMITWKAWARPEMGLPLTYVSGFVIFILMFLHIHRRHDNQRKSWTPLRNTILFLIIGLMVGVTFTPQSFQRPFDLFRAELPNAWLVGMNMRRASAGFANLQGANLFRAKLQAANLSQASLQKANFYGLSSRPLTSRRPISRPPTSQGPSSRGASSRGPTSSGPSSRGPTSSEPTSGRLSSGRPSSRTPTSRRPASRQLTSTTLTSRGPSSGGRNFTEAEHLTQDQVNTACVDEDTKLPEGLTKPPPCPNAPPPQ